MDASKETAEEQLLRMIEGPQPGGSETGSGKPKAARRSFRVPAWGWKKRQAHQEVDPFLLKLRWAGGGLWAVILGLVALLAALLFLVQPRKPQVSLERPSVETASSVDSAQRAKTPVKPLSEYLVSFGERNPFTGVAAQALTQKAAQTRLEELAKNLNIVGIDRGPRPAAIIESANPPRTYTVGPGDDIEGILVKRITAEGVVLSYEGQELVLR